MAKKIAPKVKQSVPERRSINEVAATLRMFGVWPAFERLEPVDPIDPNQLKLPL